MKVVMITSLLMTTCLMAGAAETSLANQIAIDLLRRDAVTLAGLKERLINGLEAGTLTAADAASLLAISRELAAGGSGVAPVPNVNATRAAEELEAFASSLEGVPESVLAETRQANAAGSPPAPSDAPPSEMPVSGAPLDVDAAAPSPAAVVGVPLTISAYVPSKEAGQPDLVMIDGGVMAGVAKSQYFAIKRDGALVVKLLVLKADASMAMAMVIGASWLPGASRQIRVGEQVVPVEAPEEP